MSDLLRATLIRASQSAWLRERATRYNFVRRSVSRFMPGEEFEDAMAAAQRLQARGESAIFTRLGENVSQPAESETVTRHYLDVLDRIYATSLDAQISVKLTQLGLDLDSDLCCANLRTLAQRAQATGSFTWVDMEGSAYVDRTLDIFRRVRREFDTVGICLQAYLHRTAGDLSSLMPLAPAIRLVKGAYSELPSIAFARRRDVD